MSRNPNHAQDPFDDFLSSPPLGSRGTNGNNNQPGGSGNSGGVFERLGEENGDRHMDPFFDE